MTAVKEKAYAKINLYLDVISVREDGFHNIRTIMHTISLCDDITVSIDPSGKNHINITMEENTRLPHDDKNLAVKAAKAFMERLGIEATVNIKLAKRIPVSAGLAGGSSDAAAVLRALNRIYKRPLTVGALAELGASLGSDVPYCVIGKTALCEGRGEHLSRLATTISLNVVVAASSEHISTPEAYKALDARFSSFDGSIKTEGDLPYERMLAALACGRLPADGMFNIFEEVVLPGCPEANRIKSELSAMGAISMMSGSGPSVFGIFETPTEAENACKRLKAMGYRAWCAKSV